MKWTGLYRAALCCLFLVGSTPCVWALEIVVEREPPRQTVLFQLEIQAGSSWDPEGREGLANFTARALWRGTRTRTFKDLQDTLDFLGARVAVLAESRKVAFFTEIPAAFFESFLFLLRDVLTQPRFDPQEVDLLRKTLRREIRESGAQNPSLGTEAGVQKVRPSELRSFYQQHYRSHHMRVWVVSPWEERSVLESLNRNLDTLP